MLKLNYFFFRANATIKATPMETERANTVTAVIPAAFSLWKKTHKSIKNEIYKRLNAKPVAYVSHDSN